MQAPVQLHVRSPLFLQVEPVGQCNLRCRMCAVQYRDDAPEDGSPAVLPYDTFVRLIDECADVQELHLQGLGEPLMHPRFFDLVAYAAHKGIRVTTNSNLTLLRPWLAERCITSGLAALRVSLDGATAATYERIRVGARFDRVVRNIKALIKTRALVSSKRPTIGVVMVLMRQNLHELPALVELAHGWGGDEIFVQHLCHDFGEPSLPAQYTAMREFVEREMLGEPDQAQVEHYFSEARAAAERCGMPLRLPRGLGRPQGASTGRCEWPWRGPYISYQGYVMPCCMVGTPDRIHFGKVGEEEMQGIWRNAAYDRFRMGLTTARPHEICRSCSVYKGTF